ncbi:glycoside hydrolase family 76 protein [Rhodococcus aetherivorans]|uniref:glycoside hydrolase family 76 protein n=1 Tax=Rhodococcus aetherivorans TaxID=191292 RepID=UPI000622C32A|nr:glycoside hydrolase family 76 protein [Rhodococcus aetherivorans]AKE91243.1 fructose-bisphosphate aldolase [Rhodococcus aetherivorans]
MSDVWAERADLAEAAVMSRHVRRLWALPGTALGVVGWPAVRRERLFLTWHYWWQAHLIDLAVDAAERETTPRRRRRVLRLTRSHRIRNLAGWTNNYFDDMAWLGLALERAQRHLYVDRRDAIAVLENELFAAWAPERGGGIPWRRRDDFYNTPANGPAGLLLARTGKLLRAQEMADWIHETLHDAETGLIFDGIRRDRVERAVYTYCQGVVLGLETELAVQMGDPRHRERVHALVDAVDNELTERGVITGGGGGDGGLFNGILVRYLAMVATTLPVVDPEDERARRVAARIVLASAQAAWANRLQIEGLPLFGRDWSVQARLPGTAPGIARFSGGTVRSSGVAERDLSVQLSGWMLMESAYAVAAERAPGPSAARPDGTRFENGYR